MRFFVLTWALISVFWSVSIAAQSNSQQAPASLKIGVENLLPHSGHAMVDGEGYANQIVREIFTQHQLQFECAPYARLKRYLSQNRLDMILLSVPYDYLPENPVIFPNQPIASSEMHFFVLSHSNWQYGAVQDHQHAVLGLTEGLEYPELAELLPRTKANYYVNGDSHIHDALKLLLNGKLDIVYEDRAAVLFAANTMQIDSRIKDAGRASEPLDMFIAINANHAQAQQLADQFDTALSELRRSGRLSQILATYQMQDLANQ